MPGSCKKQQHVIHLIGAMESCYHIRSYMIDAGQGKVVASLDVDHSGSRVVAGSRDYGVKLFDFNGMKSDLRSFRSVEPFEGHPVHAVSWSPTGAT